MEVTLPGGLPLADGIERRVRFRPITGHLERAIAEVQVDDNRARSVTGILARVVERIGDEAVDANRIARLSVADREYLMLHLLILLEGDQTWLELTCAHCESCFDIDFERSRLPIKPAGDGYPVAGIEIGGKRLEIRVPNGADQEAIAAMPDAEALHELLRRCIAGDDGGPAEPDLVTRLSAGDIEAIDAALDEMAPAVCDRLTATCPECGTQQVAALDHFFSNGPERQFLDYEVHALASHYHWSEREILDLPQGRRQRYLDLINRHAGAGAHP